MTHATLGELIRAARIPKDSLRGFARMLGVSPSYMSDIERNLRVPAEPVLLRLCGLLSLDFDEVMALAGRFGEEADRYMQKHPTARMLFRRIVELDLPKEDLVKLVGMVDRLSRKRI